MSIGKVLLLCVVVLGGGIGIGKMLTKDKDGATASTKSPTGKKDVAAAPADGVDRVRVPAEGATKGPMDAKVTIVEFSDFQCPFCSRVVPTMRLLAVSVDDDWDKIRRFFAKGSDIGVLLDTSHDVPKKFGTEKFPETFLIDSAGRVRYYFINKRDWSRPEAVACLESLR